MEKISIKIHAKGDIMDKQLILKKLIEKELQRHEELQKAFEREIKDLPDGAIIKRGDENYYIKGRYNGKQFMTALDPSDKSIYKQLVLKRYIKKELPVLKNQIRLFESFIEKSKILDPCRFKSEMTEPYRDLCGLDIFLQGDFDPEQWKEQEYKRNPFYPEGLIHMTGNGIRTRSKSETMIGMQLERSGFSFRVEEELVLSDKIFYPDFTVLQHEIRRLIYWEHLGLIDDPEYVMKNLRKLEFYSEHGIILGHNLVITYETKDKPLTIEAINETIEKIRRMGDDVIFW